MKCVINNEVVLSRGPDGPVAAHIGAFARSLSTQGYTRSSIHRRPYILIVISLAGLAYMFLGRSH